MNKLGFILLIAIFSTFAVANPDASPYALSDEVQAQVDDLHSTITGHILSASTEFDSIYSDIDIYGINTYNEGYITIDTVHEQITAVVVLVKDFATSAGKDPTSCTADREEIMESLPAGAKDQLTSCVNGQLTQADTIVSSARYTVDIVINKVDALGFQVTACNGDLLCLASLVTQIETAMVDLPRDISVEVERTRELVTDLKVIIDECTNTHIGDYSATMSTLLNQITDCIDAL